MKFLVEAIGAQSGGGAEMTRSLLRGLGRDRRHEFVALVPDVPPYAGTLGNVRPAVVFPPNRSLVRRHLTLNRDVPRLCKREGADALLCLGNFPPVNAPCPTVVFLQNAWYLYGERAAKRRLTLREKCIVLYGRNLLARRAGRTHVVVQTEAMKARLASLRGGDDSGISVIPIMASFPATAPYTAGGGGARARFTFLCISRYAAHKNFEILLDAIPIARKLSATAFRCLLTTGANEHPGARKLLDRIEREGLEDWVVNLGPVPHERIAEVYAQADAHLLPTLLESYGLTYDEAMHFGVPILTSDRDFARERCQDAAVYFDPLDARSVALAMAGVMENPDLRARLVEKGRRILENSPSWEETAARLVEVLERVATGRPVADPQSKPGAAFIEAGGSSC